MLFKSRLRKNLCLCCALAIALLPLIVCQPIQSLSATGSTAIELQVATNVTVESPFILLAQTAHR